MNKSFPFIANSIIFLVGIFGIVLNLPYLSATCMLIMSLLFIWCYGNASNVWENEDDATENEMVAKNKMLSNQVKSLIDANNQLISENERLKENVGRINEEKNKVVMAPQKKLYACPLTSSVPVNINNFLEMYVQNGSVKFEKSNISVKYSCQSDNAQTYLSESALTLICNNIFDNILKFAPKNSCVFVMMTEIENDSLVILKNSGKGIPESELERIFELNFKGANSLNGNGLGLSQVREIIEDFGGHVWVKSTVETGFALYLQIPMYHIPIEQRGADNE